ncbi:MAG: hypothetical protein A3F78_14190 [Burkholderiales bacterium RIFCSPLOWO2_12_FULL_61_40]|nr:MAG: hypothetical protein A3F78_14190 [Burkholderiales bacterium RIFCSPLOWO2_12_FULL_61_40]
MGYSKKFTLLWLVSLVAIAVVIYGLFVNLNRVIQPSLRQLEGLALIEPLSRTVQQAQLHRGLSAALLGGNAALRERRAAQEAQLAQALRVVAQSLPAALATGGALRLIQEDWERLRTQGLEWTAQENFAAHTRLIEQLQLFEISIADSYALVLDPEIATFYLIDTAIRRMPHALEYLGQLRAYGTVVLGQKSMTPSQTAKLHALQAQLDSALQELKVNIEKTGSHHPAVRASLLASYEGLAESARQVSDQVDSDLLSGLFAMPSTAFLNMATAEIDKGYTQLHGTLLPTARTLIELRIAQAQEALFWTVGGALLLFLLVVYLAVGSYYAIVGSIRSLVRSAHALAEGDLSRRVTLRTRDELSLVGDSVNRMADGFSAMLAERTQAQEVLAQSQRRLRAIIETALDAVVQIDAAGTITGWNVQAETIFGWSEAEALGRPLHETVIPPQYRVAHTEGMQRFLRGGEKSILNSRIEISGLHRSGHEFPIELTVTPITTAQGYEFSAFIRDITQKKQSEGLIWKQANFDALTGLPNRHMLFDRLGQEIKRAERARLPMALLYLDLDRFKEVNDTLGHRMGDLLLLEASRRISACVRDTDTVARMGGDEFIVILTELNEVKKIDGLAQNILDALAQPFKLEQESAFVTASIGITLYPHDATGMETLIQSADQAMYAAKNTGRNRFCYFTQAMQQAALSRLRMTNDLRGALAGEQFRVYYQPIMDLAAGRITKAEALVRWQHPTRGLVSPAEFVPLAEETGLILEIGDWVFRQAVHQAKQWRNRYDPQFQISVNMSPVQFHSAESPCQAWLAYMREQEVPGQAMVIEITEGLLLKEDAGVKNTLQQFHAAGVKIALDDFGTGYSSLSYLQKFDIDYLKIDQSFTGKLEPGSSALALCDTIIIMAHRLGMQVIAEGVETQAQRALLAAAGCNYGQGYLVSRPVPPEAFEALLRTDQAAQDADARAAQRTPL